MPANKTGLKAPPEGPPTLKLTEQQFEVVESFGILPTRFPPRIETMPNGSRLLELSPPGLEEFSAALAAMNGAGDYHDRARIQAVEKKVNQLAAQYSPTKATRKWKSGQRGSRVYQFRIVLIGVTPVIWRRIIVPDGTLAEFHWYIQRAMGWENCHLHQFSIEGKEYSMKMGGPFDDFPIGPPILDESKYRLSQLVSGRDDAPSWRYWYDFGDDWHHDIRFEGFLPAERGQRYPICVDGAGPCPPEDCGGVWRFCEYIDAVQDPEDEDYEEFMEWYGPYDPGAFNAEAQTKLMQRR